MKVPLSVACWDYDRTRALIDGRVAIEGCDATFFPLPVEETFFRALRHAEFDVAELSLSSYLVLVDRGRSPYVAIPAFISRAFRHSAIYIRTDRGIKNPADLVGRRRSEAHHSRWIVRKSLQDFLPTHLRHSHVQKHDRARLPGQSLQCLPPVGCLNGVIPQVIEAVAQVLTPVRIIIDDENLAR